jgi:hypothetical protein
VSKRNPCLQYMADWDKSRIKRIRIGEVENEE